MKKNHTPMNVKIADSTHGKFAVFPNDAIGKMLLTGKTFEPHFYQVASVVVRPGDTVIDCGANLGLHTVTLSKLVGPEGTVISVEPLRIIFQQLCCNVFLNELWNVVTANVALGKEAKMVSMDPIHLDRPEINIGGTKVGTGGDSVAMIMLDMMNAPSNVSFMKLDVQGNEVNLLDGAAETIARARPVMFVEIEDHWLRCFDTSSEELMNKLLGMDYILLRIKTEYPCDHVAVPKEKSIIADAIINNLNYPVDVISGKSVKLDFSGSVEPSIIYNTFTVS